MHAQVTVLLLPGWLGSGPGHWQGRWAQSHGDHLVQQDDWTAPLRGDWICQLEAAVLQAPFPVLLGAHSLGCHLAAGWASTSGNAHRVTGALLVAPPDLTRDDLPPALQSWQRYPLQRVPFPTHLISSSDDPYCSPAAAKRMAAAWGSRHTEAGALRHINAESGLGDWTHGRDWLLELARH